MRPPPARSPSRCAAWNLRPSLSSQRGGWDRGPSEPLDLAHNLAGGVRAARRLLHSTKPSLGRMLRGSLGRDFPPPLVTKIHEQTAGNPFFAIEIGRALGAETPSLRPGKLLPVPHDLEELLSRRFSSLSPDARFASLLIAASPRPTREIVQAAGGSEAGVEEASGRRDRRGRRSEAGVHAPAPGVDGIQDRVARARRRAHARLADLAPNREERARHLALSSDGPDEDVARALAEAAQQAEDRGAPLAAAELFELAASLTPPPSDLIRVRLLRAAANLFDAGDGDGARRMVEELVHQLGPGAGRADALRFLSFMSWNDVLRAVRGTGPGTRRSSRGPFPSIDDPRGYGVGRVRRVPPGHRVGPRPLSPRARGAPPGPAPKGGALGPVDVARRFWADRLERPQRTRLLLSRATPHQESPAGASITLGRQLLWAGDLR